MSLGLVLTLIFLVLKLCHVIDWSWWLVVLPELIEVGIGLFVVMLMSFATALGFRSVTRR